MEPPHDRKGAQSLAERLHWKPHRRAEKTLEIPCWKTTAAMLKLRGRDPTECPAENTGNLAVNNATTLKATEVGGFSWAMAGLSEPARRLGLSASHRRTNVGSNSTIKQWWGIRSASETQVFRK